MTYTYRVRRVAHDFNWPFVIERKVFGIWWHRSDHSTETEARTLLDNLQTRLRLSRVADVVYTASFDSCGRDQRGY